MAARSFSFTSESVTEGHPDKIADQISDSVLDAVLADDPNGRVACETLITTGLVVVAGEITTETCVDVRAVVRDRIAEIGYTRAKYGFDFETCGVVVAIDEQSADIAQGVDESYEAQHGDTDPLDLLGAGDQGMMFGYATRETDGAHAAADPARAQLTKRLAEVRKANVLPYLRPDGKSQVTVRYEVDEHGIQRPVEIERILISTQHRDGLDVESLLKPDLLEHVVEPILHADFRDLVDPERLGAKDFLYVESDRQVRHRRPDGGHRARPAARSSSTRTAARLRTAAAPSPARIRRRSTARRRTPPGTSPRTSSPPASPTAVRSRSRTRSASPTR